MKEDIEELKRQLEELKRVRRSMSAAEETIAEEQVSEEEVIEEEQNLGEILRKELEDLDKEIKRIKSDIKSEAKEFEESYKKLQVIADEHEKRTEQLLAEEDLTEIRDLTERLKLEENAASNKVKMKIDAQKAIAGELDKKRKQISTNLNKAEALGLTYDEYKIVTSTIKNLSLMDSILEEKGLSEVIEKKASERTQEENNLLKEAKDEILVEISDFRRDHDDYTVLDTINALYSLDTMYNNVKKVSEPNILDPKEEFKKENLEKGAILLPHRIKRPEEQEKEEIDEPEAVVEEVAAEPEAVVEEVTVEPEAVVEEEAAEPEAVVEEEAAEPETVVEEVAAEPEAVVEEEVIEAPIDMIDAKENEKVDINNLPPAEEKVTVFKNDGDYYVRRYAADRFKLKSTDFNSEVRIKGSLCYKISEEDVERIKENANNEFSPYIADIKEVKKDEIEFQNKPREDYPVAEPTQEEITDEEVTDVVEEGLAEAVESPKEEITEEEVTDVVEEGLAEAEKESIIGEEPVEIEIPEDGIVVTFDNDEPITEPQEELEEDSIPEESVVEEPAIPEIEPSDELSLDDVDQVAEEGFAELEKFTPTNIKSSEEFKEELKDGEVLYNIVHTIPHVITDPGKSLDDEIDREIEEMMKDPEIEDDKPKQR